MAGKALLKSECGQYRLGPKPTSNDVTGREMFDRDGNLIGTTTYWSNRFTSNRVRFETGIGPHKAVFSYPMYPRWFRRRWVSCFDIWIDDLCELVASLGGVVVTAWKPDINCWCHIGFKADADTTNRVDEELTRRGYEWHGPPCKSGGWDIGCPHDWRKANAEIIAGLAKRKTLQAV